MWKFWDFSITQILREINFGEFQSSEIVVFAIFNLVNFSRQKVQKYQNSEPLNVVKRQILKLCIRQN